jgi:hypothetical protein
MKFTFGETIRRDLTFMRHVSFYFNYGLEITLLNRLRDKL